MRLCSCQGDNPNCYVCSGKGYVTADDLKPPNYAKMAKQRASRERAAKGKAKARVARRTAPNEVKTRAPSKNPNQAKSSQAPKATMPLVRSVASVPPIASPKVIASEVQREPVAMKAGQPPAGGIELLQCRVCSALVSPSLFEGHKRRHQRARCPQCGVKVSVANMDSHLRKHLRDPVRRKNAKDTSKHRQELVVHSDEKPGDGEAHKAQGDSGRRLDATYGEGGTFRDGGRFGSGPSRDGFDDESSS